MSYYNYRDANGRFVKKNKKDKPSSNTGSQPRDANGRFSSFNTRNTGGKATPSLPKRDAFGKFISNKNKAKKVKSKKTPVKKPNTSGVSSNVVNNDVSEQVTHVHFLIDASGSMQSIYQSAIASFNEQLGQVKVSAHQEDQVTKVSVSTFESNTHNRLSFEEFPEAVRPIDRNNYILGGSTPLVDAVGFALQNYMNSDDWNNPNHSYLLIIITDGGENSSYHFKRASKHWNRYSPNQYQPIQDLVRNAYATDRVTLAFSGPRRSSQAIQSVFGVPASCVQEWEQNLAGIQSMTLGNLHGTKLYFDARSKGSTKLDTFYTNLDNVTTRDLNKMTDVSSKYRSWSVPKETDITNFVMSKVGNYVPGNGFYELMKPETIQTYKNILIKDRSTGRIYGGNEARQLLGLPENKDCKVKPGNHANFTIFVSSTSTNRKLVRGTTFLYRR